MKALSVLKTLGMIIFAGLLIFFSSIQNLCAIEGKVKFEKGIVDLPAQMEGNMIRDNDGFLWFCYYGGVGRYDGYEVRYYEPGPDSLSGSAAMSIALDKDGTIWILTKDNGLNRYDKQTDKFTHYRHDPEKINSISSDVSDSFCPQRLFVDKSGQLMIGTMGGFDIYDKKADSFTHYKHDPDDYNSLSKDNVTAIVEDNDGIIWIGTSGGGLNRFDRKTGDWMRYRHKPDDINSLASDTIWSLLAGRDGTLWVGTWDAGLDRFDKKTGEFTHYQYDSKNPESIGANNIYYLSEDMSGNIWIAHKVSKKNAGLEMLDRKTGKFIHYAHDPKNSSSVSSDRVSSVYEDTVTGIFWVINTNAGIIDKYDKNSSKFLLYQHDPSNPDSIASNTVLVMLEDSRDRFWISTLGSFEQFDRKTGKFIHHPYKEIGHLMGPYALAMLEDSAGDVWILNEGGALTRLDIEKMKPIKNYAPDRNDPNSLMVNTSYGDTIIEDRENPDILWIVLSSGLEKFDKKTETFTHFIHDPDDPNSIPPGTVWSVWDDGKGTLWASIFGGLGKFDKKTETFTNYTHDPDDPNSIGFNKNSCVFEDSFKNFWVAGFANGMDKMDRKTGKFTHFNKTTGLPIVGINHTIQEDKEGNLWIGSTESGLVKFNIKTKSVVTVYTKSDGLQGNAFWRSYKTKDGKMWFGGGGGLNSFFPDDVTDNPYIPPVVLTSFKQGGEDANTGMAPEKLKEIKLDWTANFFEFQFAALNYTRPEKNQYAYMLEGRDKDWYHSGTNPSGRYTGLSGGIYTLKLKGANNDGIWNEEGTSIRIIVMPPPWKTGWAYVIYALVIFTAALVTFAAGFSYVQNQNNKMKRLKAENEAKALLTEMDLARKIQTLLLPTLTADIHPDFEIAARMIPADQVGGDFYDITFDGSGNLWIAIGDVSGHGVTPGLIMMMAQTVHATVTTDLECNARDAVVKINEVLYQNVSERLKEKHFMTFNALKYLGDGKFEHAGAHLRIIVYRRESGQCELIGTKGIYLNFKKDISKATKNSYFELDKGDVMVLYTDGLTEAQNSDGEMLDIEGFIEIVKKHFRHDPKAMKKGIIADVLAWCDNKRDDDMTIVVVQRKDGA
ncbi:two-component regulator propeller domain-containing protein [Desulfobacterales bacterium HSG16]|nr:two-component regulator propeller domain-containing protein [Desulfobacterales bacterium HSG16]